MRGCAASTRRNWNPLPGNSQCGGASATNPHLLNASPIVALADISGDKYYGRVVAALTLADGSDPTAALLSAGLAHPYRGERKKAVACS